MLKKESALLHSSKTSFWLVRNHNSPIHFSMQLSRRQRVDIQLLLKWTNKRFPKMSWDILKHSLLTHLFICWFPRNVKTWNILLQTTVHPHQKEHQATVTQKRGHVHNCKVRLLSLKSLCVARTKEKVVMVRRYFYLINYIIDRSLLGYKGQVFCMEPKKAACSCYMETLLGKTIHATKGKRSFSKMIK